MPGCIHERGWSIHFEFEVEWKMATTIREKELAPDFELADTRGETIRLSAYRGRVVLLVLLRGFM